MAPIEAECTDHARKLAELRDRLLDPAHGGPASGAGAENDGPDPYFEYLNLLYGDSTDRDEARRSDVGNARRLVARHGQDLHHVPAWGGWLVWDGTRWAPDTDAQVARLATETTGAMLDEALAIPQPGRRCRRVKHVLRSESHRRIDAMVALAAREEGVPVGVDALDADAWLLNCTNGTVDLRTGQRREHRREDLITCCTDVAYDPDARCDRWERFIDEIAEHDAERVAFLERAVGYALSGSTREQCLLVLCGTGANGKSTLVNALRNVLGSYARQAPPDTFLLNRRGTVPADLPRLRAARLVTVCQPGRGRRLAEDLVKQLTGQDRVAARRLYGQWFEFTPRFKIWLVANRMPIVRSTGRAMWRRLRVVPFGMTLPPDAQDRRLAEALDAGREGILAWAVRGCMAWQRDGLGVPGAVRAATRAYRDQMDDLGAFLADRCTLDPDARVTSRALRAAYTAWCESNRLEPLGARDLGMRLGEHGLRSAKVDHNRGWVGIGLRGEAAE